MQVDRKCQPSLSLLHCALVSAILAVTGCSSFGPRTTLPAFADLIFVNAKVYTLEDAQPWAEAVAIRGDRIVYVGTRDEAMRFRGDSTQLQDLEGKLLLPGFIDAHSHPIYGGSIAQALSLDTNASVDDWVEAVGEFATANPHLPLIFGYGFLASAFGEEGPTKEQLDAVVSDRPVLLMDEGFHGAWSNSRTLERLGIAKDTPDPVPGFSYYKRDADGHPTGYFLEGTAEMAMDELNFITREGTVEGVRTVFRTMNQYGITAAFDAGAFDDIEMELQVLKELEESGRMTVRLVGSFFVGESEQAEGAVEQVAQLKATSKADKSHINTLKIMDDGTIEGRTAGMFEDYQGEPGNRGATIFSEAELRQMIGDATARGIDVHVHALGERAIHEALNAIEAAKASHPDSPSRYTLCHIQVITDGDVERFAALDVIAQSTPLWATYDEYGEAFVSQDQFQRYFRFKSLKQAGARLTFGSDFPATGAGIPGLSPLLSVELGHTRQYPGERNSPIQPAKHERLDIASLIRGYTLDAAYQLHLEDEIGSLAAGKKADLIVLERDPFSVDPYEIHQIRVLMTMMDGKVVYEDHNDERKMNTENNEKRNFR
jgi:predicted amidohydrolase YtcJ